MPANQQSDIGKLGEELASDYLQKKGYEILKRNFRFGHGEIDIIAEKDGVLVFVEVKTKQFGDFGDPIHWVTRRKQLQIGKIAHGYLYVNEIENMDCRFDVIILRWEDGNYKIEHIEDAFWL
ncbi:MAG: YraN family protein [Calditrichaeota bacterium]|nr:YraN family protein [Calditrichota bacterium]